MAFLHSNPWEARTVSGSRDASEAETTRLRPADQGTGVEGGLEDGETEGEAEEQLVVLVRLSSDLDEELVDGARDVVEERGDLALLERVADNVLCLFLLFPPCVSRDKEYWERQERTIDHLESPRRVTSQTRRFVPPRSRARKVPVSEPSGTT